MAQERKEELNNETLLIQRAHGNAIRLVSIPKSWV